jgi:hypothetical protein
MRLLFTVLMSFSLISCGGSSSESEESTPAIPLVSFAIADAPADSVTSVNVTFSSITLKSTSDNEDDESGINIPILDDDGNPTTQTIDVMDYQNGEELIIIENFELAAGDYTNLILNTSGCPQNPNGSDEFCWVIDNDTRKPLKTPSNKLKLGSFSVSGEEQQIYTIEFNLRSSLTSTAGGSAFNLKPHGIRIVESTEVGAVHGSVDANLLSAAEGCESNFLENTDHGKVVYLYQGEMAEGLVLVDEFDPDEAENSRPENAVKPYGSDALSFDVNTNSYVYSFSHLPTGNYTLAFSCSAIDDSANEYDSIVIANPELQVHTVTIEKNIDLIQNFVEE